MKFWWPIIAAVLLLIFGNGAYWSWRELQLKTMLNTTELRNDENAIFRDIVQLTEEYFATQEEHSQKKDDTRTNTKIQNLNSQMKKRRADFDAVEHKLAGLESRQPESINLYFPTPTPPTIISIKPAP